MTYSSEVLADSPLLYLKLDEASGATSATNDGSLGGTAVIASGITLGATKAAVGLTGTSAYFGNSTTANVSKANATTWATSTGWTFETWYKRDTGFSGSTHVLFRMQTTTSSYVEVTINDSGFFRAYDVAGTLNGGPTVAGIADGNWHHLAVTRSSGSNTATCTFYVDGVSVGTTSGTSIGKTTPTLIVGATANGATTAWLDEPAVYYSVLSSTRIGAHYTAGTTNPSTPIHVVAPVMTSNSITMPAPVARIINPNFTGHAPAMTLSLTAPVPVIKVGTGVIVHAPAATATLSAVSPTSVRAGGRILVTADRSSSAGQGTTGTITFTGSNLALFKAPFNVPAGKKLSTLKFIAKGWSGAGSGTITLSTRRITESWVESGSTNPANVTSPSVSQSVTIAGGGSGTLTTITVDLANLIPAWNSGAANEGIALGSTGSLLWDIVTHEDTTNGPYFDATYEDLPPGPEIRNVAPAASLTLSAPAPVVRVSTNKTVQATSPTLSLTAIAPGVTAGVSVSTVATAISAGLAFVGGISKNPDFAITAELIDSWLYSPNANVTLRYPSINTVAGAMTLTLNGTPDTTINLTTNKLSKVVGPMKLNAKMVGIYVKDADRYLTKVGTTVGPEDVWFQMEETTGTVAVDAIASASGTTWRSNGEYRGGPVLGLLDGPHLRKGAARFDGISQYFFPGSYEATPGSTTVSDNIIDANGTANIDRFDITVEFSIRTTDLDGVVFSGTAARSAIRYRNSANAGIGSIWTGNEVVLEDGYLVFNIAGIGNTINRPYRTKIRKFISDGEWHHVIISLPASTGANSPSFTMIDGEQTVRLNGDMGQGSPMLPATFMARPGKGTPYAFGGGYGLDYTNMSGFLAGDLRDVIVRNNYIDLGTARHLYWEWSESILNTLEGAATVNLSMTKPHSAKGNMKKMLVIFGLEQKLQEALQGGGSGQQVYYSNLSGLHLPGSQNNENNEWVFNYPSNVVVSSLPKYTERKPFKFEDFIAFPVSIEGNFARWTYTGGDKLNYTGSNFGSVGAEGVLNSEYVDTIGFFVDDATGERRWLNVHEDLALGLDEYDAITVMNYPWVQPDQPYNINATADGDFGPKIRQQSGRFMGQNAWTAAREEFRTNLLEALYQGTSLWITEFHMAEHLGFIQGYDIHNTRDEGGKQTSTPADGLQNLKANQLDVAHLRALGTGAPLPSYRHAGDYYFYPQAIHRKRIVATEPGLTDMPAWIQGDMIVAWAYDEFNANADFMAWDIVEKPNGLEIGDTLPINVATPDMSASIIDDNGMRIVSAKPEGIVGKVIAREQDFYYGRGSLTPKPNPFAQNATTIIAERGTILHGRPIQGRVFIELAGQGEFNRGWIGEDKDKTVSIQSLPITSTWDYDNRRYTKVVVTLLVEHVFVDKDTGIPIKTTTVPQKYVEFEAGTYAYKPAWPLGARGLYWLSQAGSLPAGAVRNFATPMVVSLTTPAPGFTKTRNIVSAVNGAMRLDVEVRQPRNYRDGQVKEKALPMILNLELHGFGKVVRVPAATLTLSMPNTLITAGGDKITVYLEREETIKLFLKEDN